VDADSLSVIVPVVAALIAALVARVRFTSELENTRNDLGRLLDQYERLNKLPEFEADARSLEKAVHETVERLRELETGRAERAWQLAGVWVTATSCIAAASGVYWMWTRDGTWWTVGAITLAVLVALLLVSGISSYRESSAIRAGEISSDAASSPTQADSPKDESPG
jgi:hypothetical protein